MAIGAMIVMNGCGATDALDALSENEDDYYSQGQGYVYNADGSVYGLTTNNLSGDEEGYDLWDVDQTEIIGKITIDHDVLDANGDLVGECFANESEDNGNGDSFSEGGFLQGSCTLHN